MVSRKKQKRAGYVIIGFILFLILGGALNQPEQTQSFRPESVCSVYSDGYFSSQDKAECLSEGCFVQENFYIGTGSRIFLDAIAAAAAATGLCSLTGVTTPFCAPVSTGAYVAYGIAVAGGVILSETIQEITHGLKDTCVSCLPNEAITSNAGACCSGKSLDLDRSLVGQFFFGNPKICVADTSSPGGEASGFICEIGRPITQLIPFINDCTTAGMFAIFAVIFLLLIVVVI